MLRRPDKKGTVCPGLGTKCERKSRFGLREERFSL